MSKRAFRLLEGEPLPAGLRRVAAGRASKAAERLREAEGGGDVAEAVHGARKDIKKLRSTLRLARAGLGDDAYRAANDHFRETAGMLGGARDAEAKLECLEALRERFGGDFPSRWSVDFVAALEAERDRIAADSDDLPLAEAAERLERGLREIDRWHLEPDDFSLIAPGLRRAYERGRDRLADAIADPGDVQIHELRKRVKDLWYMTALIARAWPPLLEPLSEQPHELSELLGDHHDLAVLRDEVTNRPECFGGSSQAAVLELIARRQGELFDAGLPAARRLYAEKPKAFTRRIGAYWEPP